MALDVQEIRSRFPGLARIDGDGRPFVLADAPGGTQVPESVIEAIAKYLRTSNANTHGVFTTSRETDALIDEARRAGADMTGADPDEIVFGPNSTSLLFSLSRAFARTLEAGDEIVVSKLDHDANVRPWLLAAEEAGASVRWIDVREDDVTLALESLDDALSHRTRLVAFTLASNAVGTIPPAEEIVHRVHEAGALAAVDAVHLAPHRVLDLRAIDADILACSPYKFFGPHLGMLALRRSLLEGWTPFKVRPAPDAGPARWETGTQNHEGLAGLVAAIDYLADVGRTYGDPASPTRRDGVVAAFAEIREHERGLTRRFLDGLSALSDVRLWGIADSSRADERTPTFAIRVGDQLPQNTAQELADRGVFVWDGHYYAI